MALKVLQGSLGTLNGMACAQLRALIDPGIAGEGGGDLIRLVAHHQKDIPGRQEAQLIQHMLQQRPSSGHPEDLGQVHPLSVEPGPLPGGQNDGFDRLSHTQNLFLIGLVGVS